MNIGNQTRSLPQFRFQPQYGMLNTHVKSAIPWGNQVRRELSDARSLSDSVSGFLDFMIQEN
jgi:hypothetical protein